MWAALQLVIIYLLIISSSTSYHIINSLKIEEPVITNPVFPSVNHDKLQKNPRCGLFDNLSSLNDYPRKWNKTDLKWDYVHVNHSVLVLTQAAFKMWEKQTGLTFHYDTRNPDIIISNKKLNHTYEKYNNICPADFDGKGNVIAHAFYPYFNRITEIHIDMDEIWSLTIDEESQKLNLFGVLVHEIGHTLGLQHTNNNNSIMYPYYNSKWNRQLHQEDLANILNLYGETKNFPVLTTSTKPVFPTETTPILCTLKDIDTFLIVDQKMYVFYKRWIWLIDIHEKRYTKPKLITDFFKFLPHHFNRISSIYRRPNGDIVILVDDKVYMVTFPNMKLVPGYPKSIESAFRLPQRSKINCIINTYSGRTYVLYNNYYYAEIDECNLISIKFDLISQVFPGVPSGVNSGFKYTNGLLYFFKNGEFYEFNEFTNKIIRSGEMDLSLFDLKCPKITILEQIKRMLGYFITWMPDSESSS